jgi:hypothetical protein
VKRGRGIVESQKLIAVFSGFRANVVAQKKSPRIVRFENYYPGSSVFIRG